MSSPKVAAVRSGRCTMPRMAMAVLLEDLHVGEGFVALLDEPEMLVEPHDDVDLGRKLAGEFVTGLCS